MKVYLADKYSIFLEGLQTLLSSYGFEVGWIVSDTGETLDQTAFNEPAVIIININGDEEAKLETVRYYARVFPEAQIIVFTDDDEVLRRVTRYGVSGHLLAEIRIEQLIQQIRDLELACEGRKTVKE